MVGVAQVQTELTGYKDCKSSGFYFLLHLNYRRTAWRVICCPHAAEVQDMDSKRYPSDPQQDGQFEIPAYEGQKLGIEYENSSLWLTNDGTRVARGCWKTEDGNNDSSAELPEGDYRPTVLT